MAYEVFMGLKKPYNAVDQQLRRLQGKVQASIKSFYEESTTCARVASNERIYFGVNDEFGQGCGMTLFNEVAGEAFSRTQENRIRTRETDFYVCYYSRMSQLNSFTSQQESLDGYVREGK